MDGGMRLINAVNGALVHNKTVLEGLGRGLPNLRRVVEEASQRLDDWGERLGLSLRTGLASRHARLAQTAAAVTKPGQSIDHARARLDGETRALAQAAKGLLSERRQCLKQAAALLQSFSYQRVLERGFALVSDAANTPLTLASNVQPGTGLTIQFQDGKVAAVASGKPVKAATKVVKAKSKADAKQGRLL